MCEGKPERHDGGGDRRKKNYYYYYFSNFQSNILLHLHNDSSTIDSEVISAIDQRFHPTSRNRRTFVRSSKFSGRQVRLTVYTFIYNLVCHSRQASNRHAQLGNIQLERIFSGLTDANIHIYILF